MLTDRETKSGLYSDSKDSKLTETQLKEKGPGRCTTEETGITTGYGYDWGNQGRQYCVTMTRDTRIETNRGLGVTLSWKSGKDSTMTVKRFRHCAEMGFTMQRNRTSS